MEIAHDGFVFALGVHLIVIDSLVRPSEIRQNSADERRPQMGHKTRVTSGCGLFLFWLELWYLGRRRRSKLGRRRNAGGFRWNAGRRSERSCRSRASAVVIENRIF